MSVSPYQIFAYNYLSTSSPMLWNNTDNIMYAHTDVITSLIAHTASSILYSASLDGRILQWNLLTGAFIAQGIVLE